MSSPSCTKNLYGENLVIAINLTVTKIDARICYTYHENWSLERISILILNRTILPVLDLVQLNIDLARRR